MDFLIGRMGPFTVEHCFSCALPGYLIVSARAGNLTLSDLGPDALPHIGPALAVATRAIEAVIAPIRVYCALFGEEQETMHFHVFPRTSEVTAEYLLVHPEQAARIHGPMLLDWARTRYKGSADEVFRAVSTVLAPLREHFARLLDSRSIAAGPAGTQLSDEGWP